MTFEAKMREWYITDRERCAREVHMCLKRYYDPEWQDKDYWMQCAQAWAISWLASDRRIRNEE